MNRPGPAFSVVALLLTAPASGLAQLTNSASLHPALPEVSFSVFRVCGALALVLALFLTGVWLFKNWQRLLVQKGRTPKLNILEVRSLGNRHALYVVAYEQQRLMLAASPSGVNLVSHLPAADAMEPTAPAVADFSATLQAALQRKV
jgi:flagellar biogenesis protein FliO